MSNDITEDRDKVKALGEVFTPTSLVNYTLDLIEQTDPTAFVDVERTFIDSMCGDGQFLVAIKDRKIANGQSETTALSTIYGIELSEDNASICSRRLNGGNIVAADSLGSTFTDKEFDPTVFKSF